MDERVVKFRVGVMVISTMFLAGILLMLFSDAGSIVRPKYSIIIHFNEAPGVTEGTPVRKSGILIGRVTKVDFAQEGGVNVTAEINEGVVLYRSEVPQVTGSLLGGDVVIQFIKRTRPPALISPPNENKDGQPNAPVEEHRTGDAGQVKTEPATPPAVSPTQREIIQPGDYITGIVAPSPVEVITNLEGNLAGAIDTLSNAGNEVGKVAASINRLIDGNEDSLNSIIEKTETTLASFQKALENIDDVIGNPEVRENLRRSVDELPQLLSDTRGAMNTVRTTVESVDRNLRNLEGFTAPLGERGAEIIDGVDRTMLRLDGLISELSDFGKKLNSGEGSLGRIMSDPELYQNLNKAAQNIAQLTCELRPVVADARVFADKIARHPELLGVRGAIRQSPGTK